MSEYQNPNDLLDDMIEWEQGTLSEEETVTLFQKLVDSGLAWQLQGVYGRTAAALIDAGLVVGVPTLTRKE